MRIMAGSLRELFVLILLVKDLSPLTCFGHEPISDKQIWVMPKTEEKSKSRLVKVKHGCKMSEVKYSGPQRDEQRGGDLSRRAWSTGGCVCDVRVKS